MHLSLTLLPLFPLLALATVNGHCSGTATGDYLKYGICISTSECSDYKGSYITGGCPNDVASVKCCLIGLGGSISTEPCGGASYCSWNSLTCMGNGHYLAGESKEKMQLDFGFTSFRCAMVIGVLILLCIHRLLPGQVELPMLQGGLIGLPCSSAEQFEEIGVVFKSCEDSESVMNLYAELN